MDFEFALNIFQQTDNGYNKLQCLPSPVSVTRGPLLSVVTVAVGMSRGKLVVRPPGSLGIIICV
jgi:hypothetical protein